MGGGKPVDYLQAWSRIWPQEYREQIQLVVQEPRAHGLQVQRSDLWSLGHADNSVIHTYYLFWSKILGGSFVMISLFSIVSSISIISEDFIIEKFDFYRGFFPNRH